MKKPVLFILFFTFLLSKFLFSQIPLTENGSKKGYTYLIGGIRYIDLNDLNNTLTEHNYPQFSNIFLTAGIGHRLIYKSWFVDTEGRSVISKNTTHGNYETYLYANWIYLNFDIGRIIYHNEKINLYPMFGMGGAEVNFSIVERNPVIFDSVLTNPSRGINLKRRSLMIYAAFGADYFISLFKEQEHQTGLVVGLRTGYSYSPYQFSWKTENIEIKDGPSLGITGPFIELTLGYGSIR